MKTSPIMLAAINHAKQNKNKLARYPGGFWMRCGVNLNQPDFVDVHVWSKNVWFGTQTIRALLDRNLFKVSAFGKGGGRYAVEVELTRDGLSLATNQ